MRQRAKCTAMTQAGEPCRSFAVSDRGLCVSHDPEMQARKAEGNRKGGEARSSARRAAKMWAAAGAQMGLEDLPAVLRSCMFSVKTGTMEPSQATAIAALAKASLSLSQDLELERRIAVLEEAAGVNETPANVRRIR